MSKSPQGELGQWQSAKKKEEKKKALLVAKLHKSWLHTINSHRLSHANFAIVIGSSQWGGRLTQEAL